MKIKSATFILILFALFLMDNVQAQTDVEFWFVAPEITIGHGDYPGGEPVYFRVSALDLDALVHIYQPANPAGLDTTFIVPANTTVSIDASPWINDLENKPGGIVLNKGVYIVSSNLITVYYDEDEYWNQDIFALKGDNALGLEFYTPFNSVWNNGNYTPLPYSSIDIVATEDNSSITITPTADLVGGYSAGVPFTITLDRGETFSCLATTQAAAGHLGGTHIVSDQPIAVTLKDDSVDATVCQDLIGDQTVPLVNKNGKKIVGFEYIVMRGKINLINPAASPPDPDGVATGERIYIMATEDNTEVYIDGLLLATLANAGQQTVYEIRNNATHVRGDKPIMVLHTSGFGCELGGAILPTIDGCTGSVETSFTRSTDRDFYLNIMTQSAAASGFTMYYEDGTSFDIPSTWFEPVGSTGFVTLKKNNKLFANSRAGGVPQGEVVKVRNSINVFHLGLIEGGRTSGCKYGYFSDYSVSRGDVLVVETGSNSIYRCFGDTVQLRASGGISYEWSPSTYLNDPFIATPIVIQPPDVITYEVKITRGCFGDTTVSVVVGIADRVESFFEVDKWYICAPDTIAFDNQSIGVDKSSVNNMQWDFDFDDPGNLHVYDTSAVVKRRFENNTDSLVSKTVQLLVWNHQSCPSEFRREIFIRPEIKADFIPDVTEGCQPVHVNFNNTSTGNTDRYKWELGDGNSSKDKHISHTYLNYGMADSIYNAELVAISPYYCSDTARAEISVYPYLEASFAIDTFQGCSPLVLEIDNNSAGYIEEYEWDFGDGNGSSNSASSLTHIYTNTGTEPDTFRLRLVVKNNTRGCTDTLERLVTVYPEVDVDFTADYAAVCSGSIVGFANLSSSTATSFSWDFGDGGSSSQSDPAHYFENMTVANVDNTVSLVGTTPNLCRDTAYQVIRVHPYIKAEYSANEFQGCAPFELVLENVSEGAITDYDWDWGDGTAPSISSDSVLTHIYENTGAVPLTHKLLLEVQNADGCTDTIARNFTVLPEVNSLFSQNTTEGCNELDVSFTNLSSPSATSYFWDFGDGASSTDITPAHTFRNATLKDTTYSARLIALTNENCPDTSSIDITVYSFIKANFTFDQATVCSPFEITFQNTSIGGVSYAWDFGDGNSTTRPDKGPVTHTFVNPSISQPITYTISLTVENSQGCTDVMTRELEVQPAVHAGLSADHSMGCHPLKVHFSNLSSGAESYVWDFGNGQSSDQVSPDMSFENYGSTDTTFIVKLMAINGAACEDSAFVSIVVHPHVVADFAIEYDRQCAPAEVSFVNSSVNGEEYAWDFAGTPSVTTSKAPIERVFPNTSYSNSAYYDINLLVTSAQGCTAQRSRQVRVYHLVSAEFSSITEGCQPLEINYSNSSQGATDYLWELGDNSSSIKEHPTHVYTNFGSNDTVIDVKLYSMSENFCIDSASTRITVYPKPRAKIQVDNIRGCSPITVAAENLSTNGDTYTWSYGDATPETIVDDTRTIQHVYVNDQPFSELFVLELGVNSASGCVDTIRQNITVYSSVVADFEMDSAGCAPFTTLFTNNSLRALSYTWDFGDKNFSYVMSPGHTFLNTGSAPEVYDVVLMAYSEYGCGDTLSKEVTVHTTPIAKFDHSPIYQYFPDATVQLANETNPGDFSFEWDFDDGTNSTEEDPLEHIYGHWGEYEIQLKASNQYCADSVLHWLKIFPPLPIADFEPDIYSGCMPLTVYMSNFSMYGESYLWDFGDGSTSTEFEPLHEYTESGLYQVKLTVFGEGGQDYTYREIEVYILPEIDFQVSPDTVMLPDDIAKVFNFTQHANAYLWDMGDGTTYSEFEFSHLYTELGVYDVGLTAWTEHGCESSLLKERIVHVIGEGKINYPDVFAPSSSGPSGGWYSENERTNRIFAPVSQGVMKYHLLIYNRWGELLFESNDVNQGWDGYHNGKLCPQGVYIWKVDLSYTNNRSESLAGDVTLLHYPE